MHQIKVLHARTQHRRMLLARCKASQDPSTPLRLLYRLFQTHSNQMELATDSQAKAGSLGR